MKHPVAVILAAWLVPGSGHFILGHRRRGVVFLLLIVACLALGCSLHGKLYRFGSGHPLEQLGTVGSMGGGLGDLTLRFLLGYQGDPRAPGYEYGTAFLLTAGLMNLLLLLDVWDLARGDGREDEGGGQEAGEKGGQRESKGRGTRGRGA